MATHNNVILSDIINTLMLLCVNCNSIILNVTKVMNVTRMISQTGVRLSNDKFTHKRILSSKTLLTHNSSRGHNFSYLLTSGIETLLTPTGNIKVVCIMSQNIIDFSCSRSGLICKYK